MRYRLISLLCLFFFIIPGCQLFAQAPSSLPPVVSTSVVGTLTAAAWSATNGAGTLTAAASSATAEAAAVRPTPSAAATATPEGTPALVPDNETPPQAAAIVQPAGQITIILLGSDQRPQASDYRTDVSLVVVLRPDGSVNLISFPRDLWVYLPGHFMQRINTAQEFGGFSLLQATYQYNFGFTPQSYVLTNFDGFRSIINGLGGIDVSVEQDFHDVRSGYQYGYTVKAGLVHMDEETALWYVRARESSSDLDRLRRAQEVIVAIGLKLLSLNGLARVPELYQDFRGAVITDLTLQDATNLLPALQKVDPNKIHRYAITEAEVIPAVTTSGADVLLPRSDAIRQLLEQALGSP